MLKTTKTDGRRLERHYSIGEASRILGIPASTMKAYLLRGLLPRVKIGEPGGKGRVLIKESDLAAFLERHRENGSLTE